MSKLCTPFLSQNYHPKNRLIQTRDKTISLGNLPVSNKQDFLSFDFHFQSSSEVWPKSKIKIGLGRPLIFTIILYSYM